MGGLTDQGRRQTGRRRVIRGTLMRSKEPAPGAYTHHPEDVKEEGARRADTPPES